VAKRSSRIPATTRTSSAQRSERAASSRVIHSKPERRRALPLDRKLYRIRYVGECCFHELKRFRAIGTRYDNTKSSFLALLQVACICLWLN
jgi:transposase